MKYVLILALTAALFLSGCGTMKGLGGLVGGIGQDIEDASDGYNRQYYNRYNK